MSIEWILSSSVLILLIMLERFLFRKKFPPGLRYAMWLLAALRLLLPVSISETTVSILNLLPEQSILEEKQKDEIGQIIYETRDEQNNALAESDLILEPKLENLVIAKNAEAEVTEETTTSVKAENEKEVKGFSTLRETFVTGRKNIEAKVVLMCFWLLGAGGCGVVFLCVNLDYGRRLRRSRKSVAAENLPVMSAICVYQTPMVQAPCLFGLVRPAIYITEDMLREERTLRFVICHENTHYRQHDHWWALLRMVCLCVHWFNPLVWLAARLSRLDGEIACDEKALKVLGDEQRVDYGRTLLELSVTKVSGINGWRISTSMSGNARQMKERLWILVNTPGRTIGIHFLGIILVILLTVITFTGESRNQERENSEPALVETLADASGTDEWQEGLNMENETETQKQQYTDKGIDDEAEMESKSWNVNDLSGYGDAANLSVDLNFDGHNDLCVAYGNAGDADIFYSCMLWNPEIDQYEYSATLFNVEVDAEQRLICESIGDGNGRYSTIFYRYDADNRLHMVRYVEENSSPDAAFAYLDLTYVEDDSIYTLPAVVDGTDLHRTLIAMAGQSLEELYLWTGEKVDTTCFQVTNMGDVYFGLTSGDIEHSRIFFSRSFGADTMYNLSNYEKSISSMYVMSGRSVWYSPVFWRIFPDRMNEMTDEEIIIWYLERVPLVKDCRVKSIEKRYEDMWTVHTEDDVWFEVVYDVGLKEVGMVSGPYPDYPQH